MQTKQSQKHNLKSEAKDSKHLGRDVLNAIHDFFIEQTIIERNIYHRNVILSISIIRLVLVS
jgi:hypothetical protein